MSYQKSEATVCDWDFNQRRAELLERVENVECVLRCKYNNYVFLKSKREKKHLSERMANMGLHAPTCSQTNGSHS